MKRKSVSARRSKAIFSATASRPHPKNLRPHPARGGIRL